ncbi:unnamed protein product [Ambrosiozyma monospora]|uniref:Unnamed protein product n=1 Tax=Ambrosiozyma monospora TaxID=43982 RepID=A0A9W6YXS1_AMBMO|nr:unnamed protein product [Ambrosiozyma monospora]
MLGKRAKNVYLALTNTTVPSNIIKQLIQGSVNREFEGFPGFSSFSNMILKAVSQFQIKTRVLMALSESSPQTASLLERWFILTSRSDFQQNTPPHATSLSIT